MKIIDFLTLKEQLELLRCGVSNLANEKEKNIDEHILAQRLKQEEFFIKNKERIKSAFNAAFATFKKND